MPLVEIKDFNFFVNNKPFFEQTMKNKQDAYKKTFEISRINDYTTKKLLDYCTIKNITKSLSRQTNIIISQQISFMGKFEKDDAATTFFIAAKP